MNNKHLLYYLFGLLLFASSCSNTKYLKEGELLYVGGSVKVEGKEIPKKERKALKKELEDLLRPKPNSRILGLRPKLYFYNIAGTPKKDKGFKHWLKYKVGEAPVLFGQVDLQYNADVLRNYTENKGFFKVQVESDSTRKGKKATAEYIVKPGKQYKIKQVTFPEDSSEVAKAIQKTKRRSLLKVGNAYDFETIKAERERIDERLKERGFFYFGADYIMIQVDSTVGKQEVDLIVKVKDETPAKAKEIYKINDIIVYPNYSLRDSIQNVDKDVVQYKDFTIIDKEDIFDPRIFDRTLYFHKGDIYNRTDHNLSLNRLVNMGTFKFVKNQFRPADTTGNFLDTYYYLTPLPKKSFRVEVLGKTNSANYTGTELNINWSNRNTFKGAELLTVTAFGGMEVQVSGQNNGFNVYRIGGETSLIWPRFIGPFKLKASSGFVPKTKASLGYEFQQRSKLYSLNTFKGSFGYLWKENIRKEHQLNVTDIVYVSPQNVTSLYDSIARTNPALQRVIDKQLIFGPTYSYTFTNTMRKRKKHTIYFKGGIDLAGTITGLATGADVRAGNQKEIFDVPFSQFVRLEADFRHYLRLGNESQLASRIIVGSGFAYGNSEQMPFIKQFFIGGTNSIRAFRARSIGPGSSEPVTSTAFLPDQSGDVKLELNTEYRTTLFSIVKGAVFIDAGNIWMLNDDEPAKNFSSKFLDDLAVGTGVGLRFDLSFLVLRTDLAFPIRLPYGDKRWVLDDIAFGDGSWRKQNLIFNLAIGYPF
ncbi:outer membrane protein assembly factor BamA [Flavobacterium arsenatis]|uniref:Outer membrane protein assembly factor BamA n=1 Tax=Flavobacterium arsenatis TaxID=1484332 RepID=A0ABU1TP13_9FLAO|nr:BamA/TamA family outer membrane protein [Flavobacterium arsenatis]MDR6967705.1 outer membrane protein assembly factor BamA [Flavobacterium arsenatis]